MAMVVCSVCGRATLNEVGRCQFCGSFLKTKLKILTRKLRRKEAYGFLLGFSGVMLLRSFEATGILLLLSGLSLIGGALFLPRVRRN
jgi:hypothetical protein